MKTTSENTAALNGDLFVLKRKDGCSYILYSPLNKKVGLINASGANTLHKYFRQEPLSPGEMVYIDNLYENRFLNHVALSRPVFPANYDFMPHEVTLFATSRCNLRCRYCYAEAGKKSEDMSTEIAKAAIDLVANHAGRMGLPEFAVGFHGGGEPTVAWNFITETVGYAREKADRKGLEVEIFAASNGMFNEKQRDFILKYFTSLNISLDGPEDVQNYNRPCADGSGSFARVRENLKFFDAQGFKYGIRATVTERNVHRMAETVEWFASEFNFTSLHLEPVWSCGRCLTTGETAPRDEDFIHHFVRAMEKAEQVGIRLEYSGLRLDSLISRFCAATGDGFNVLPDGRVSSCYEITEADDPKAALFHYGRYDAGSKAFVFDKDRIQRLQRYSVEYLDYCRDCFCKWHCAGDCLSKVFDAAPAFTHQGSPRCKLNRRLTLLQLEKLITQEQNKAYESQRQT
jgi:uncharacterized protein